MPDFNNAPLQDAFNAEEYRDAWLEAERAAGNENQPIS